MSAVKEKIDEVTKTHVVQLEKFTAAFISEVGSAKASEYTLVETQQGTSWQWRWVHNSNIQDHGYVCSKCASQPTPPKEEEKK